MTKRRSGRRRSKPPTGHPAGHPGGRRGWKKDSTRRRIVAATLDLFQTKGFETATTRQIAHRAGVAEGTVFNYFKTKEDIALHFFEQEVEHVVAALHKAPRLKDSPIEEKLFALVQSQLEYLAPYEKFIGAALVHALKPASRLGPFSVKAHESWVRYLALVQDMIEEAIRKKEITPLAWWMPQAFGIYYLGVLFYWLHDTSEDKQNTLAFLDRSLKIGVSMLKRDA